MKKTYASRKFHRNHRHNHPIDRKPIDSVYILCCYIERNSVHTSFSDIPFRPIYLYNHGRHHNAIGVVNNDHWIYNGIPI